MTQAAPPAGARFTIALVATIVIVGGGVIALVAWVVSKVM
jgi:hypothetical protein